ncbi:prepilin peptidase [Erwinia amylovora]|uniref:prepilin peptidase n=1 Tax=Erwinia amylovora TaxID=552 RepID=UPI001443EFA1|nr:prepilin peptidase [Erwinia amylovora]UDJ86348.1 prepilin peptidase [Erwinia amylovora]UDJ97807.1 prepilin peptidase [Erwinia amylovora]UDK90133.1 prepilin peptidase [Erwinia amylovora]UDK93525.1 prepilin peptidase [Erwinia amylovora]UOD74360.1 prepilin peptidase [Erwinia amylovora]
MTLLTLSMPWPFLVVIFPLCLLAFFLLAAQIPTLLASLDAGHLYHRSTVVRAVWLYAAATTVILLAPGSDAVLAFFFCLFLFRMAITDSLTGLLPRKMTLGCLLAGLAAALTGSEFVAHLLAALAVLLLFGGWRFAAAKWSGREVIGLGDVWLAGGVCAWLGWQPGLNALLTGVVLFVLWQLSLRRTAEGGPLGPWLCVGALAATILKIYQPLITW